MPAELEINAETGIANVFSVKRTMWHRDGHVLPEHPTWDEAERLAGHNYEVIKVPTYLPGGEDGTFVQSEHAFVTLRTDTRQELGQVGSTYVPVQNWEAFRVLRPLIDSGIATLETGGTLRNGADAWLMVRFALSAMGAKTQDVFGEEVLPYGVISTNHTGRRGVLAAITPVRVVCANTLGMVERGNNTGSISVRHTMAAQAKLVEAAEDLFLRFTKRCDIAAEQYAQLKRTVLSEAQFAEAVLDVLSPDPRRNPQFEPTAKMARIVCERADARRAALRTLWDTGDGHTGNHTAWEAYNAATQALDHRTDLFPTRAGVFRTASALDGRIKLLKTTVMSELLALAV